MQTSKEYTPEEKRRRKIALACVGAFLVLFVLLCWFAGKPMLDFVAEPQKFREWVGQYGLLGKLAFVGMVALQVVVAVIPGEPLEIAAGYAFGIFEGTLLCLIGITLGSALVFLFVRKWGIKAVELFFPREKIQSLAFLQNSKRLNLIVFILFFIPGTPKDVMTYFIGLTPMKLSTWLVITMIARIPSVITSTIGGDALGLQNYQFAILVFAATIVISLLGILAYRIITKHGNEKEEH